MCCKGKVPGDMARMVPDIKGSVALNQCKFISKGGSGLNAAPKLWRRDVLRVIYLVNLTIRAILAIDS